MKFTHTETPKPAESVWLSRPGETHDEWYARMGKEFKDRMQFTKYPGTFGEQKPTALEAARAKKVRQELD